MPNPRALEFGLLAGAASLALTLPMAVASELYFESPVLYSAKGSARRSSVGGNWSTKCLAASVFPIGGEQFLIRVIDAARIGLQEQRLIPGSRFFTRS